MFGLWEPRERDDGFFSLVVSVIRHIDITDFERDIIEVEDITLVLGSVFPISPGTAPLTNKKTKTQTKTQQQNTNLHRFSVL